jgi:DNA-binding transcriptional ArsR family regulator
MSTAGPKQQVFASLAEIAQALGHAHRLELLEHLGQGERSVEELAARAGLTLANASRHLQLLRRAALVEGRREGKRVFYRLSGEDTVIDLLRALSRVGERNSAEIARVMASYFHARDEFDPVSRQELLDRLRCGSAAVLDVRPEDEFNMGHLPSALNIPLAQLERRLAELPLIARLSLTVVARGACCHSRPLLCCVTKVTERDGSKMASRNGKWQGSRSARRSYRDPGHLPTAKEACGNERGK